VIQSNGRTSKSKKVRSELATFSEDAPSRLRSIKGKLSQNSFTFEPAEGIPLPKKDAQGRETGAFRPIVLARVESRIVQRAILNVLLEVPELQPYIKTPYSFGGIRGERRSQEDLQERSESLSAVPAAIRAVLDEISSGARFVACADIRSFFTRISKDAVTNIISVTTKDEEFTRLFRRAIDVELSNMAQLRERASAFPIEDIGVAQGNSLSPLLGNIILAEFDKKMNEGDCRCIRYIDDFIILAPSKKAAGARLRKATELLAALGMELSPEKSSKGVIPIDDGIDFLGINICRGAIRPNIKAQGRILHSVQTVLNDSLKAMRGLQNGKPFDMAYSLSSTLKKIDDMIDGWGKHYWFCNDRQIFENLDNKINEFIRRYLGEYTAIRSASQRSKFQIFLGITELRNIKREPFSYPKLSKSTRIASPTPHTDLLSGTSLTSDSVTVP